MSLSLAATIAALRLTFIGVYTDADVPNARVAFLHPGHIDPEDAFRKVVQEFTTSPEFESNRESLRLDSDGDLRLSDIVEDVPDELLEKYGLFRPTQSTSTTKYVDEVRFSNDLYDEPVVSSESSE